MKKNDYCMVKPLSGEEHVQVIGRVYASYCGTDGTTP